MPALIIIGIVALIILFGVVGYWQQQKRRKELSVWAASRGLRFDVGKDRTLDDQFHEFDCLRQGSNRYASNKMQGNWNGRELLGFDYHYETRSRNSKGRSSTDHHDFSVVILHSEVPLKPLFIRPEGFFDKVTEFFGFDDIDFESAEFSRKFYVKSPDRKWAYDVIHARTMQFLLTRATFTLRFGAEHVMASRNRRFKPAEFEAAVEVVSGILDRLPEYLLRREQEAD